jgi:hypothetical protein
MPSAVTPRRVAVVVWAAMLLVPFAFLALTSALPPARAGAKEMRDLLFWLVAGISALAIVLSRALPRRIGPRTGADGRDLVAFTRLVIAWSLCEAAALFPLVARMLTEDARLLAFFALNVLALATLFPSEGRWAALAAPGGPGSSGRLVR